MKKKIKEGDIVKFRKERYRLTAFSSPIEYDFEIGEVNDIRGKAALVGCCWIEASQIVEILGSK